MLYAAVSMCPVAGGTIASVDDKVALAMHGVVKNMRSPAVMGASPSVVVVAKDFWTAHKALALVKIVWDEGAHAAYGSESNLNKMIEALNTQKGSLWHADGNLATVERSGARRIDAVYTVPLLAHAALEPATCTALYETSGKVVRLKIWAPTQTPAAYVKAAAKIADITEDNITIQPTLIGGGFGYKGLIEPLLQAVVAAKALPDTPVQVQWTREQDIQHDLYRPAAVAHASAWLRGEGQTGQWAGWRFRSASASVIDAFVARMVPTWLANRIPDKTTIEGAFDNRYKVDAQEIYHIKLPTTAPIGFWRSVGHSHQAFFVESFVDEVAHALKRDPLKHRLRLLVNTPRYARVLQAATDKANWTKSREPNTALGLALHESFGSICAQVVELRRNEAGAIHIERVTCAIDCGRAIQPDIITQQVESAVIFGLTAALYGRITMNAGRVEQTNFTDYPLLTLARSPIIDTIIMPSDEAPGGVGEVGTPPIAPALCNAIFRLTGKRIRDLPIANQVVMS
jgi:isoquinoline 1-oxidoreductase beta subunit